MADMVETSRIGAMIQAHVIIIEGHQERVRK